MKKSFISILMLIALQAIGAPTVQLPATGPQPSAVDASGKSKPLYKGSYALLISASKYLGVGKGGWHTLDATGEELDRVAAVLRQQGFNVTRISDPNSVELSQAFLHFGARYGRDKDNRLLFFFSGHGYTDKETDMGYLVPVDARDPLLDPTDFYSKALPIGSVELWARQIISRHAIYIFDSCFSGSIFLSRGSPVLPANRGTSTAERYNFLVGKASEPVRQFIAAGGPNEKVTAKSDFVPLFIKAIQGAASAYGDGYVTGKEIGIYLEQMLPKYNPLQNPHSDVIRVPSLSFGDMVFQPIAPVAYESDTLINKGVNKDAGSKIESGNASRNIAIDSGSSRSIDKRPQEQPASSQRQAAEVKSINFLETNEYSLKANMVVESISISPDMKYVISSGHTLSVADKAQDAVAYLLDIASGLWQKIPYPAPLKNKYLDFVYPIFVGPQDFILYKGVDTLYSYDPKNIQSPKAYKCEHKNALVCFRYVAKLPQGSYDSYESKHIYRNPPLGERPEEWWIYEFDRNRRAVTVSGPLEQSPGNISKVPLIRESEIGNEEMTITIYDSNASEWTILGRMKWPRKYSASAAHLKNDNVLLCGRANKETNEGVVAACYLYKRS